MILDQHFDNLLLHWVVVAFVNLALLGHLDPRGRPGRPMSGHERPDLKAPNVMERNQPVAINTGIIAIQKMVDQPFTRRVNDRISLHR